MYLGRDLANSLFQIQYTLQYDIHLAASSEGDAPDIQAPLGGEQPLLNRD